MCDLSIVIITWNAERFIEKCFDSVLESTKNISREIIVIDNGSSDSTRGIIKSYTISHSINFIENQENLGISKARNIGLKIAKGKYIWILDIDTIVNEKAIKTMLKFMDKSEHCGICGCKLLNSKGFVQDSCRKTPSLRYKILNILQSKLSGNENIFGLRNLIEHLNESQFYHKQMKSNQPFEVEYLIGACQLVRKKAMDQVGYLDEKIFFGPEDADFCLRMSKRGWKIYYLPEVSFVHEYQQITNKKLFSSLSKKHTQALIYFLWKHKRV